MKRKIIAFLVLTAMLSSCLCIAMPTFAAANKDPYSTVYAVDYDPKLSSLAASPEVLSNRVGGIYNHHHLAFPNLDFGEKSPTIIELEAGASAGYANAVVVRIDDPKNGKIIAEVPFQQLGFSVPSRNRAELNYEITGVHTVYITSKYSTMNFYNFRFIAPRDAGFEYDIYRPESVYTGVQDSDISSAAELLWQLGIFQDAKGTQLNASYPVNRAVFANAVYGIYKEREPGAPEETEETYETGFPDVPADNVYAEAISVLAENDVIKGNPDGMFVPHQYITGIDAVVMLVRIMGYDQLAQIYGGYPNGYIKAAREAKIMSADVTSEPLRLDSAIMLLYNTLNAKYLSATGLELPELIKYEKSESILEMYRGLKYGEGKLVATAMSGITLPNSGLPDDIVQIDGKNYDIGTTNANSLLGYECEFYYKDDSGKRVLYAIAPAGGVEVTRVDSTRANPIGISDTEIVYLPNGAEKDEIIELDSDTYVFYNGVVTESTVTSAVKYPENFLGHMVVAENNDGTTLVYIEEYVDYIVESTGPDGLSFVAADGGGSVSWEDDDLFMLLDPDGLSLSISEVETGTPISVFESANTTGRKLIRAYSSTTELEGEITEIDGDSYIIDGKPYTAANNITHPLYIGTAGTFKVNAFGDLVYLAAPAADAWSMGLLIDTDYLGEGFSDSVVIKIAATDLKETVYTAASSVTADGVRIKSGKELIDGNSEFAGLGAIKAETLVRYKLNTAGNIIAIDTPEFAARNSDDILKCLFDGTSTQYFRYYRGSGLMFSTSNKRNMYYMPGTTPVFTYYNDGNYMNNNYGYGQARYMIDSATYSTWGSMYSLAGDVDTHKVDFYVWKNASESVWALGHFVYESSRQGMTKEGDPVTILRGTVGGKMQSFNYSKDPSLGLSETSKRILDNLEKGDVVILTAFRGIDCISKAEIRCLNNGAASRETSTGTITPRVSKDNGYVNENTNYRAAFGTIVEKGDGYIALKVGTDATTGDDLLEVVATGAAAVTFVDTVDSPTLSGLSKITDRNLAVGDVVYVSIDQGECSNIIVFDDADI